MPKQLRNVRLIFKSGGKRHLACIYPIAADCGERLACGKTILSEFLKAVLHRERGGGRMTSHRRSGTIRSSNYVKTVLLLLAMVALVIAPSACNRTTQSQTEQSSVYDHVVKTGTIRAAYL